MSSGMINVRDPSGYSPGWSHTVDPSGVIEWSILFTTNGTAIGNPDNRFGYQSWSPQPMIYQDPTPGSQYEEGTIQFIVAYQDGSIVTNEERFSHVGAVAVPPLPAAPDVNPGPPIIGVSWNGFVYEIDRTNGDAVAIGASGFSCVNSMARHPSGTLYAASGNNLITIDPTTGVGSVVAVIDLGEPVSITSMAFSRDGTLYAVQYASGKLYTIDIASGNGTLIGSMGQWVYLMGLAFSPEDVLYGWWVLNGLVKIDRSTGAGSLVDPSSLHDDYIQTLAFDEKGLLYGGGNGLYIIDTNTGRPMRIGNGGQPDIRGMEFNLGQSVASNRVPVCHYVSTNGLSIWPYTNWMDAARNVDDAVHAAQDHDTVLVTNGTYTLGTAILVTNAVWIRSVNGPRATTIMGTHSNRCFYLGHPGAVLEGLTITRDWSSVPSDQTWSNADAGGVRILFYGGTVRRCVISNHQATYGAGIYSDPGGVIENCAIANNSAGYGGGVWSYRSLVQNCTIAGNSASVVGGATVIGNSPGEAVVRNTIVNGNSASAPTNLWSAYGSSCSFCCTTPLPAGPGNMTTDPQFVNASVGDYHLQNGSPCIDAGNTDGAPDRDMDGVPRPLNGNADGIAAYDMGAYEFVNPLADTDGDQMSDGWEISHGLNPASASGDDGDAGDPDGDGASNLAECLADTDPKDADSVLRVIRIEPEHGGIRIDWKGGVQAWQILECRKNLTDTNEDWLPILGLPPPTSVTNAVIDMGTTNRLLFYRIRAER